MTAPSVDLGNHRHTRELEVGWWAVLSEQLLFGDDANETSVLLVHDVLPEENDIIDVASRDVRPNFLCRKEGLQGPVFTAFGGAPGRRILVQCAVQVGRQQALRKILWLHQRTRVLHVVLTLGRNARKLKGFRVWSCICCSGPC